MIVGEQPVALGCLRFTPHGRGEFIDAHQLSTPAEVFALRLILERLLERRAGAQAAMAEMWTDDRELVRARVLARLAGWREIVRVTPTDGRCAPYRIIAVPLIAAGQPPLCVTACEPLEPLQIPQRAFMPEAGQQRRHG